MLPLHGQNTAALNPISQWAGHTSKTNEKKCFWANMKILPNS